jgi:hypothetical protein
MRLDDLTRGLQVAAAEQTPADPVEGRAAVDRRVRHHGARRASAVFAVLALIAIAAVTVVGSRETDDGTVQLGGDPPIPHLAPAAVLPAGCRLKDTITDPRSPAIGTFRSTSGPSFRLDIYARRSPGRSIEERIAADSFALTLGQNLPVQAPAQSAYTAAEAELWNGATGVRIVTHRDKTDRSAFTVQSRVLPADALVGLFSSIRLLDYDTADPSTLPPDYERVVSAADPLYVGYSTSHVVHDGGYSLVYECDGEGTLTLTAEHGDTDRLTALRWALGSPPTLIRGRPGTAGTAMLARSAERTPTGAPSTNHVVAWLEDDRTLVTLDSRVLDPEALTQIAESLTVER